MARAYPAAVQPVSGQPADRHRCRPSLSAPSNSAAAAPRQRPPQRGRSESGVDGSCSAAAASSTRIRGSPATYGVIIVGRNATSLTRKPPDGRLGEREPGGDAAVGVRDRRLLLGDEVAEPERHPGAVHLVERLRHVRVVAVDEVDVGRAGDPVDDVGWYASGAVEYSVPKCSPTSTTSAPSRRARGGVGDDPRRVDQRHRPRQVRRHRDAVGAVRVVEQRRPARRRRP